MAIFAINYWAIKNVILVHQKSEIEIKNDSINLHLSIMKNLRLEYSRDVKDGFICTLEDAKKGIIKDGCKVMSFKNFYERKYWVDHILIDDGM